MKKLLDVMFVLLLAFLMYLSICLFFFLPVLRISTQYVPSEYTVYAVSELTNLIPIAAVSFIFGLIFPKKATLCPTAAALCLAGDWVYGVYIYSLHSVNAQLPLWSTLIKLSVFSIVGIAIAIPLSLWCVKMGRNVRNSSRARTA